MGSQRPWVSASDIGEYAYCPRAHWYSTHPEATRGAGRVDPRAGRGQRFHRRVLKGERRRAEHLSLYVGLLLLGLATLTLAWILLEGA